MVHNLDQIVLGIILGVVLSYVLLWILINVGCFIADKVSDFVEYFFKLSWLRKRNKHRKKCGLPKLKISDYEYR